MNMRNKLQSWSSRFKRLARRAERKHLWNEAVQYWESALRVYPVACDVGGIREDRQTIADSLARCEQQTWVPAWRGVIRTAKHESLFRGIITNEKGLILAMTGGKFESMLAVDLATRETEYAMGIRGRTLPLTSEFADALHFEEVYP